jgi:anti-sigma factor RsiW
MPDPKLLSDADRADLVAYLDGELEGDARRRVETKLATDPATRAEADALKRAWDLLDVLPKPQPSTDFTARTIEAVTVSKAVRPAAPRGRGPWLRPLAVAAAWTTAAVIAVAVGYAVTPGPRPVTSADVNPDTDPLLAKEPGVIENLPLYLAGENLDYILALDQSDLFADDTGR